MVEQDGKDVIKTAIENCYKDFISRHKDIQTHFPNGEQYLEKIISNIEVEFLTAEISSGKSDDLSKD